MEIPTTAAEDLQDVYYNTPTTKNSLMKEKNSSSSRLPLPRRISDVRECPRHPKLFFRPPPTQNRESLNADVMQNMLSAPRCLKSDLPRLEALP